MARGCRWTTDSEESALSYLGRRIARLERALAELAKRTAELEADNPWTDAAQKPKEQPS